MLKKISISNIALIEQCQVEFEKGFNVLSGETGSGKSIIIDSINFVLGARQDKSIIKNGYDFAKVIAEFDSCILERTLSQDGKNICLVNGQKATLSELKEVGQTLMDIHGQHEHQQLLDEKNHLQVLDLFIGEESNILKQSIYNIVLENNELNKRIKNIGGNKEFRERTIDFLNFQINEIETANIIDGEYEELCEKREKLLNEQKISENLQGAHSALSGDETFSGALKSIADSVFCLNTISKYDEQYSILKSRIESLKIEAQDIDNEIENIIENETESGESFEKIDERLDNVKRIFKKYGGDYNSTNSFLIESKQKLNDLINSEEMLEKLTAQIETNKDKALKICRELSILRKSKAKEFECNIKNELKTLGMQNAEFIVNFEEKDNFDKTGIDEVYFVFSANLGEQTKPLAKIISGGELSRLSLAIKVLTSEKDNVNSMIFDEIDTGISGNMAQVIAEKMAIISKNKQVLVVSHLPQMAAMADYNFYIEKSTQNNKTSTSVFKITGADKVKEVARLIGSNMASTFAFSHANELIENANKFKATL